MTARSNSWLDRFTEPLMDNFGLSRGAALSVLVACAAVLGFSAYWFHHLAPPTTITFTSGPKDSSFQRSAERYAAILKRSGITLRILPSEGSVENLKRLNDPSTRVDAGFVQGGIAGGTNVEQLMSLGSITHQPLMVFYRGAKSLDTLAQLEGRRVAIGPTGSGTQVLALAVLKANGIEPGGKTALQALDADATTRDLREGKLDAAFLSGDSAPVDVLRKLETSPGVRLFNFSQADGYTRRFNYLSRMTLPRGSLDLGKDIPAADVMLVGPTIELVARQSLDPALTDLLMEAARETHGGAGLFKRAGDYPALQEHEYSLSPEAVRFNKSGKSFFYRTLPFWVAGFVDRVILVFLPLLILSIPALRVLPALYALRVNLGMYRWYRALQAVEREMTAHLGAEERGKLVARLEHIEREVHKLKVPSAFAFQFYELRGHIGFVRTRLLAHQ